MFEDLNLFCDFFSEKMERDELTLFHVASEPTYFTLWGEVHLSNFVIFKDRDLKFGDNVYFEF